MPTDYAALADKARKQGPDYIALAEQARKPEPATQTDYAALADQARGQGSTMPPVDYSALAEQSRRGSSKPPQLTPPADDRPGFFSTLWDKSVLNLPKSVPAAWEMLASMGDLNQYVSNKNAQPPEEQQELREATARRLAEVKRSGRLTRPEAFIGPPVDASPQDQSSMGEIAGTMASILLNAAILGEAGELLGRGVSAVGKRAAARKVAATTAKAAEKQASAFSKQVVDTMHDYKPIDRYAAPPPVQAETPRSPLGPYTQPPQPPAPPLYTLENQYRPPQASVPYPLPRDMDPNWVPLRRPTPTTAPEGAVSAMEAAKVPAPASLGQAPAKPYSAGGVVSKPVAPVLTPEQLIARDAEAQANIQAFKARTGQSFVDTPTGAVPIPEPPAPAPAPVENMATKMRARDAAALPDTNPTIAKGPINVPPIEPGPQAASGLTQALTQPDAGTGTGAGAGTGAGLGGSATDFKTKAASRGVADKHIFGSEEAGILHGNNTTFKNANLVEFARDLFDRSGQPKLPFTEDAYNKLVGEFNKLQKIDPRTGKPFFHEKAGSNYDGYVKRPGRSVEQTLKEFNEDFLK